MNRAYSLTRYWSIRLIVAFLFVTITTVVFAFAISDPTRGCGKQQIGGGPNECFGTIALRRDWDIAYYVIYDSVHSYEIAGIDSAEQLIATEKNLYVINQYPGIWTVDDPRNHEPFMRKMYQDGEMKTLVFQDVSEVPTYLVIDYITNEVRAYVSIDEVPVDEQHYFVSLSEM